MRYEWIDAGNNVDPVKARAHGVTRPYFDAREDPAVRVPIARDNGFEVGIYRCQNWNNATPAALAAELSADVHRWGGDPYKQLAVHANIEHSMVGDQLSAYLVAFLQAFRIPRPNRELAIVVDGLQAGLFSAELLRLIFTDVNVQIVAEAFGKMLAGDVLEDLGADNVRSNLVNAGVARQRALVCYDGRRLAGQFWDGIAFTQGRLP